MIQAFDEVLDFVTSAPTLEQIIAFEHSPDTLKRVEYLQSCRRENLLTENESFELREFEKADYFMQQIKQRAQRRLG